MAYLPADGIRYRVNNNIFKYYPFPGLGIPEGDDQVCHIHSRRYISRVKGEGNGYRRIKGGSVRSEIIGETNHITTGGRGRRIGHFTNGYPAERLTILGLASGTSINIERNLAITRLNCYRFRKHTGIINDTRYIQQLSR